jgi:hypothetical protein
MVVPDGRERLRQHRAGGLRPLGHLGDPHAHHPGVRPLRVEQRDLQEGARRGPQVAHRERHAPEDEVHLGEIHPVA